MKQQPTRVCKNVRVYSMIGNSGNPKIWCMFRDSRTLKLVAAFGPSTMADVNGNRQLSFQNSRLPKGSNSVNDMQMKKLGDGYKEIGTYDIFADAMGRFFAVPQSASAQAQTAQPAAQPAPKAKPAQAPVASRPARVSEVASIPSHLDFRA